MVKVPGLVPIQSDVSTAKLAVSPGRAPGQPTEGPGRIQAVASPVDTFVRAQQVSDAGGAYRQVAEAFGGLAPILKEFLTKDPEDTSAAARKLVLEQGPAAIADRIAAGDVPPELQNVHGMRVWAEEKAYRDSSEIVRLYNEEFDKDNGNLAELIQGVTGATLDAFGNDRAFLEVYTKAIMDPISKLETGHADYSSNQLLKERRDTVFGAWSGRVSNMAADGKPPADIAAAVFGDIADNKDFLLLPEAEQKALILTIADREATKGNFDVAKALLAHEAGGQGTGLMSDPDVGTKATDLYARIEADQVRAGNVKVAEEAEAQVRAEGLDLFKSGKITGIEDVTIPDGNGGTKTISAAQIAKQASQDFLVEVQKEAEARDLSPQGAALLEKQRFVGNGVEHPTWFKVMEAGIPSASMNNITTDGLPPATVAGFNRFLDLYRDSPKYLTKYLSKDAVEFYETAATLYESGRYETPEAALRAVATNDTNVNPEAASVASQDLDTAVADALNNSTGWGSFLGIGESREAANSGYVRDSISKQARALMKGGMDAKEAVTKARENFEKGHINVLGTYIRASKDMPQDFPQAADEYVSGMATDMGLDADELTIKELGNGSGGYVVTHRTTYEPLVTAEGDLVTFTFRDARKKADDMRAAREADVVRKQAEAQKIRERLSKPGKPSVGFSIATRDPALNPLLAPLPERLSD